MTAVDASAPPLERIAPYIISTVSTFASFISSIVAFSTFLVSKTVSYLTFLSPIPAALYLLAPLIVFLGIATDVLARWPYQIALYAFDTFHPIYVFCGVACIVGGLVGITGRLVSNFLVDYVTLRDSEALETDSWMKKGKRAAQRSRSG